MDSEAVTAQRCEQINPARARRLHVLEVQRLIRTMLEAVTTAIPSWTAGGDHSLNMVADLSVASIGHAVFMQTDTNVGSFDAGYGSTLLARQIGDKWVRETFFLTERYDVETVGHWGVIDRAVPHVESEKAALEWAVAVVARSPQVIRMFKFAFSLADDGLAGQQVFAGEAAYMAHATAEAQEGRGAFLEHRVPRWEDYPYYY